MSRLKMRSLFIWISRPAAAFALTHDVRQTMSIGSTDATSASQIVLLPIRWAASSAQCAGRCWRGDARTAARQSMKAGSARSAASRMSSCYDDRPGYERHAGEVRLALRDGRISRGRPFVVHASGGRRCQSGGHCLRGFVPELRQPQAVHAEDTVHRRLRGWRCRWLDTQRPLRAQLLVPLLQVLLPFLHRRPHARISRRIPSAHGRARHAWRIRARRIRRRRTRGGQGDLPLVRVLRRRACRAEGRDVRLQA